MSSADEVLSHSEAAKLMGVDPKTLMKWAREGHVTAIELGRGRRQFVRSEILATRDRFTAGPARS